MLPWSFLRIFAASELSIRGVRRVFLTTSIPNFFI